MPVHIDEMVSDVTIVEGELPLTPVQIEKLVQLVMCRIADKHLDTQRSRAATKVRRQSTAPFEPGA